MQRQRFSAKSPGGLVPCQNAAGQSDWAFLPSPTPPPLELDNQLWSLVADARDALGTLNGIGQKLPNPQLLLRPLQQQEAITSSRIEGTFVTAQQLLMYELEPPDPRTTDQRAADWIEVFNYTVALRHGWMQLREVKLPFCCRLIREMHEILMQGVRGERKSPGEFRKVPAQVGSNARFIPAPWTEIEQLMGDLEKYINSDSDNISLRLVKCFIAHYQFEAIHPFEDGNGRVGRALLALMISDALAHVMPWLYLSVFFEKYRDEYVS
jgi:Fic family protein